MPPFSSTSTASASSRTRCLSPRIGLDVGLTSIGPLRLIECALGAGELPDIDVVLVSHAHFDHLDIPSLGSLRGKPVAIMASGDVGPAAEPGLLGRPTAERGGRCERVMTRHGEPRRAGGSR